MKSTNPKLLFLLFLTIVLQLLSCLQQEKMLVDYVNPFIATQGDHGHWLPAALAPFGLVELCPDTYPGSLTADGDFAHSGYDYSDIKIRGFSHFHRGSSGGGRIHDRAGLISILPFINSPVDTFYTHPVVDIDKNSEKAMAGYYSVQLIKDNILAELTATEHVGVHRYKFPEGEEAKIFLNAGKRGYSISCSLINEHRIEGFAAGKYFVIEFDSPVVDTKIWDGTKLANGEKTGSQAGGGIICSFGNMKNKPLLIKAGFSVTGIEAAEINMQGECPELDFEKTKAKTSELWNDKLSKIEVEGNTEYKIIFYTSLYRTNFLPDIINDLDGTYPGLDGKMHKAEGYSYF